MFSSNKKTCAGVIFNTHTSSSEIKWFNSDMMPVPSSQIKRFEPEINDPKIEVSVKSKERGEK